MNWLDRDWLDGPHFVAWLEECGLRNPYTQLGASTARRVAEWRNGGIVTSYMADRVCIVLDRHLSEIPDECWLDHRPGERPRLTNQQREELAEFLRSGEPVKAISRRVGCSPSAVRYWREKAAA